MEKNDEKNSISDDILKCRESILRAGGKLPDRPRIPSFEEIISAESKPDVLPATPEITSPYDSEPLSDEVDQTDIGDIFEQDDMPQMPDDSGMEVIADEDWRLPGENNEQPEDTGTDIEIEGILDREPDPEPIAQEEDIDIEEQFVTVLENDLAADGVEDQVDQAAEIDLLDPLSPTVSEEEQKELLAQPEDAGGYDDWPEDDQDEQLSRQIAEQLISMSHEQAQTDDQTDCTQQPEGIPQFNVYDRILSGQRKQSSIRRQGPGRKLPDEKVELPKPTGIVADVIENSKAVTGLSHDKLAAAADDAGLSELKETVDSAPASETTQSIQDKAEIEPITPIEAIEDIPAEEIPAKVSAERMDVYLGVIHGPDNITETQSDIIRDIVTRHIDSYYRKAV